MPVEETAGIAGSMKLRRAPPRMRTASIKEAYCLFARHCHGRRRMVNRILNLQFDRPQGIPLTKSSYSTFCQFNDANDCGLFL